MTLFVRGLQGQTFNLHVNTSADVGLVQDAIEREHAIPVVEQRLVYSGQELEASCDLAAYGVKDGSTVFLSMRLAGGAEDGVKKADGGKKKKTQT